MSEIPQNALGERLSAKHDLLIICNPVRQDRLKCLEIDGSEARITYVIDNDTTIHAPITGRISRIESDNDKPGFIIELKSEVAICILTGFDMLFVNQGEYVNAGARIGALRGIRPGETKNILLHIASKFEGVNLNQLLKVK